jgi:pyruvate/2-oxoglutarate dehydrogenase complex dihydrolipoamide dehydrogenase (E3) component
MSTHYDAIIVGTGQSGPPLADRLNREGLKVAVIERKLIGGTCVNVGCTPTKALVASARAAHMARRGAEFGVVIDGPIRVDMKRVKSRMREISGQSNRGVTRWLEGMEHVRLYRGHARFLGPNTVKVNEDVLQAERIFLNVGTRARVPEMPGVGQVPFLTSSGMMELDILPDHLIIVGGSYIGLEFAQIYRRFGSQVTIVEMSPRLIRREDPDVSDAIRQIIEREGIQLRLDAECLHLEKRGAEVAIRVACRDGVPEVVGSHILLAVGRVPNTDDLDLERAGVDVDRRGFISVDDQCRTAVAGIWALGDCNGRGAFTHTAYNDFEIVAANLFDNDPRRISDRVPCYGLFIDPPLGRIGMTEREARESGRPILVGKRLMKNVSRARERSETEGFMKVWVDAETRKILGAAILGVNGDEAVHALLAVIYAEAPYTVISREVAIHPTVSELLPTILQNLEPLESSR